MFSGRQRWGIWVLVYVLKPAGIETELVVALQVEGEVDIHCSHQLQSDIEALTKEGAHLLLDLDRVEHLDSYSLGTFLALRQQVRRQGGTMSFICNNPNLLRLFSITNLNSLFGFYHSAAEFLSAMNVPANP